MTRTTCVAFRVDADREVGLGHLRRCLTLAAQLADMGCEVRFVCGKRLEPMIASLAARHRVCSLEDESPAAAGGTPPGDELWDADATLSVIGRCESDACWVVVDSYRLGHRWEQRVRDAGHRIMVIDDFRSRMHHADMLVSDTEVPFDPALNERASFAQTLAGREYSLIAPEYADSCAPSAGKNGPMRLLVSYGGSDITGETLKAVSAIGLLRGKEAVCNLLGRVDVAIGQLNPAAPAIERAAQRIEGVVVQRAPASLAQLIRSSDLILTAGGNTMVEALALRKPCLVTLTADNQSLMASQLAAERMIRLIGASDSVTPDDVADAIVSILADYEVFATHVASRPVFDHLGAQRIATVMLGVAGAGIPVSRRLSRRRKGTE